MTRRRRPAQRRFSGRASALPTCPDSACQFDYGLADFDIRNVVHISGGYELPFGKGKQIHGATLAASMNQVVGGWSVIWSSTLQGGQPISLGLPIRTTASNLGCGAFFTGQALDLGLHNDANGLLSWFGNPGAFTQPCVLGPGGVPSAMRRQVAKPRNRRGRSRRHHPGSGTRLPPARPLLLQGLPDQRALPPAVPCGDLQHLQPPELQRTELRRQRRCGHLELGQLQQLDLRRNRFDARCSLRSAADPVRSKVVLLTLQPPQKTRGSAKSAPRVFFCVGLRMCSPAASFRRASRAPSRMLKSNS